MSSDAQTAANVTGQIKSRCSWRRICEEDVPASEEMSAHLRFLPQLDVFASCASTVFAVSFSFALAVAHRSRSTNESEEVNLLTAIIAVSPATQA